MVRYLLALGTAAALVVGAALAPRAARACDSGFCDQAAGIALPEGSVPGATTLADVIDFCEGDQPVAERGE